MVITHFLNRINNKEEYLMRSHYRDQKHPTFMSSSPSKSMLKADFDDNIELIKISLKKENERKQKLKKLLQKYTAICLEEKRHLKQIKGALIELKDTSTICKLKLMAEPTIFVDNTIKTEIRQFLCTLLNTFYQTYEENNNTNKKVHELNNSMSFLIKNISYDEDMILILSKSQINEQVQLEGELLSEKGRLKQQLQKKKSVEQLYSSVKCVYEDALLKHQQKIKSIDDLEQNLSKLKAQSQEMWLKIQQQQNRRNECRDQISDEINYQNKFEYELEQVSKQLQSAQKENKRLLKQLANQRIQDSRRSSCPIGEHARDQIRFQTNMQFMKLR